MRVGFVGLGSIGTQMVLRLRRAGISVTVYPRGAGLAEVEAAGAELCGDYAALAEQSDTLILCVYSDAQLRDVLFDQGALARLRPASHLIIHTTGSPTLAREIAARASAGVAVLDACFSGGPDDVAAGALTLMIGGEAAAFDAVRPLLSHYAAHIHHVGPVGHGQMVKLLNNLLFATNLMNAAELLGLAAQQGFDTTTVAQVLRTGSGASYASNLFTAPVPVSAMMGGARPYLEKDVATAMATATEAGLDVSTFASTAAYFQPRPKDA